MMLKEKRALKITGTVISSTLHLDVEELPSFSDETGAVRIRPVTRGDEKECLLTIKSCCLAWFISPIIVAAFVVSTQNLWLDEVIVFFFKTRKINNPPPPQRIIRDLNRAKVKGKVMLDKFTDFNSSSVLVRECFHAVAFARLCFSW